MFLTFLPLQGKVVGVIVGCLLGMFPLLFFPDDNDSESSSNKEFTAAPDSENKADSVDTGVHR